MRTTFSLSIFHHIMHYGQSHWKHRGIDMHLMHPSGQNCQSEYSQCAVHWWETIAYVQDSSLLSSISGAGQIHGCHHLLPIGLDRNGYHKLPSWCNVFMRNLEMTCVHNGSRQRCKKACTNPELSRSSQIPENRQHFTDYVQNQRSLVRHQAAQVCASTTTCDKGQAQKRTRESNNSWMLTKPSAQICRCNNTNRRTNTAFQ